MDLSNLKGLVRELTQSAEERAIARALKQFSKGQPGRAIETLKEAHGRSPEHTGILFEMARLLTYADRAAEGADAFRSILRRNPRELDHVNEVIEEIRVRHRQVGPLYDAVAEHFIRQGDLKAAFGAMERLAPEDVRAVVPRHIVRWEQARKDQAQERLARIVLASACHLALCHEALREFGAAATIFEVVARRNPEEVDRILPRLDALVAKDYQNVDLRVAVATLLLEAGRDADVARHFSLAVETDARAAAVVSERITAHLRDKGEEPALRWLLVTACRAAGDDHRALEEMRPLVEAGTQLDEVVEALMPMAAREKSGPARRLLAEAHLRRGKPQAALEILLRLADEEGPESIAVPLQALAEAHPGMARAHHLLADLHLAAGRGADAVAALRRVLELAPGESMVLIRKATRTLELDPSSPDAHLLLAQLMIEAGEGTRAVILLRHMVRGDPGWSGKALAQLTPCLGDPSVPRAAIGAAEACLELGRLADALGHLETVAASHPELEAEFLHAVGLLAERSPESSRGVVALLDALRSRSALPAAIAFARGMALFHGGDPVSAAGTFREVLQAAPERVDEVRQALELFDRDDPRSAEARHLLATIYLERRDYEAAVAELLRGEEANGVLLDRVLRRFESILEASPDDVPARLAFLQALLRGGHHDRVVEVGRETLRRHDDATTTKVHLIMAEALAEKCDMDGAVRSYFTAYRRDRSLLRNVVDGLRALDGSEGTHPLASLVLGKVLAAEGRAPEAVASLCAAVAADGALRDSVLKELQSLMESCPGDARAGMAMIVLLMERRQTMEALRTISNQLDAHPDCATTLVAHLEEILKTDPGQALAHFEMGRATQRLGARSRSAGSYLSAVRLDGSLAPLALKRLKEILRSDDACVEASLAIASIQTDRGRSVPAAESLSEALLKRPGETERLLPALEAIWDRQRDSGRIALLFAGACARAGRHKKALAAFGAAAEQDRSLTDEAFEGLDAVVAACPGMPDAYLARGRLHIRRMNPDAALADLTQVHRLAPRLAPVVAIELENLRRCFPDVRAAALLLAELYAVDGRTDEARRLLQKERDRGGSDSEKLGILLRLAHLAARARDGAAARACLTEAARLEGDRGRFLAMVHEIHLSLLRGEAARLSAGDGPGPMDPRTVEKAVGALVELGATGDARAVVNEHAAALGGRETARLRGVIALREGEYLRAFDQLKSLGPSRHLAFGAARAGDYVLASQTLESLARADADPSLQVVLRRMYREMVAAEMLGGSRRLQAETIVTFKQREAA